MSRILISTMRSLDKGSVFARLIVNLGQRGVSVVAISANAEFRAQAFGVFPYPTFLQRGLGVWPLENTHYSTATTEWLAKFARSSDFLSFKFGVMSALNRHDASGTFRMVDREAYFFHNLSEITEELVSTGVTHVFFDVTPHVAREYILFWVAKKMGLHVLFLQPVPFAGISIPKSDLDQGFTPSSSIWDSKEANDFANLVLEQASRLVQSLEQGNASWVTDYQKKELQKLARSPLKFRRLMRKLKLQELSSNEVHLSGANLPSRLLRRSLVHILIVSLRRAFLEYGFNQNVADAESRDIFVALTHEPERTFFPEALPYQSQLELMPILARTFETGGRVFIKEHGTQLVPGRRGYASRSIWGYKWLESLDNVYLIDPRRSAQNYVRDCGVVVSATGTVCMEAAIFGTRAYHYGNPWWEGFPGTAKILPGVDFFRDEPKKVSQYSSADAAAFFNELVTRSVPSTANVDADNFRVKFASLPDGFEELEILSLSELIVGFVHG